MSTEKAKLQRVKEWLLARHAEIDDIPADLDLIENRIIDSLSFMDFIFFLEEVAERELQVESGSVESFRTLQAIETHVLAEPQAAGKAG